MGGYIGARAGTLSTTVANVQDVTATDTTPEVTIKNTTETDADGGRSGKITFKGEQSGGEESTLAQIVASHDTAVDDEAADLIFKTNDGSDGASPTEVLRTNSAGNLLITSSDQNGLTLNTTDSNGGFIALKTSGTAKGYIGTSHHLVSGGSPSEDDTTIRAEGVLQFTTGGGTERMRIDSDGHLNVGHTGTAASIADDGGAGVSIRTNNDILIGKAGTCLYLNREGGNGEIMQFRQDGAPLASIISYGASSEFSIGGTGTNTVGIYFSAANQLLPTKANSLIDASQDLGKSNFRWAQLFASVNTINTSDENEKQNIASLTSAEITAATAISKLFKTYKWKDAVAKKGDDARTHTGVIAQQVQTAMSDAGLDPSKYGFWCSDTWWEKDVEVAAVEANKEELIEAQDAYTRTDSYDTKDEAPEGATEHTRLGIRYAELLSFVGAATEQRLTSIEARLTALEGE